MAARRRRWKSSTGLTIDVLSKKWMEAVRKEYLPQIAGLRQAGPDAARLTDAQRDESNFKWLPRFPQRHADGVHLRSQHVQRRYLARRSTGGSSRSSWKGSGPELRGASLLQHLDRVVAGRDPDRLPAQAGGQDALYLIEIRRKVKAKMKFGLDAIYSPTWSPDGKQLPSWDSRPGTRSCTSATRTARTRACLEASSPFVIRRGPPMGTASRSRPTRDVHDLHRLIFGKLGIAILDVARPGHRAPEPARHEHLSAVGAGRRNRSSSSRTASGSRTSSSRTSPRGRRSGSRAPHRRLGNHSGEPVHFSFPERQRLVFSAFTRGAGTSIRSATCPSS